eukprot:TRINITY_DN94726_c0_g1_i1.p2 TRINITY_DN94726_c0_g1~~TRINITY_DN94726_c0_g1_i1.p2  ORF type:complete len:294 (+),score=51.29 TRINITY_DN94726_c0_g1_i1:52-882(+)
MATERTVAASLCLQEAVGTLQGQWVNSEGVCVHVEDRVSKFSHKDGRNSSFCLEEIGGHLMLNSFRMIEVSSKAVVWENRDRTVTWSRPEDLQPLQKRRRLHDMPLTARMCWGSADGAKFSDAAVVCQDKTYAVHRAVLAAASPVFNAAFSCGMREGVEARIEIHDAAPRAVEALLSYIYEGDFEASSAVSVLPLAHRYELGDLVEQCTDRMLRTLTEDTVVAVTEVLRPLVDCSEDAKHAWGRLWRALRLKPKLLQVVMQNVRAPVPPQEDSPSH